jgi:calcium-dependent protein kinase
LDNDAFEHVSKEGQDFVKQLLQIAPEDRLSAQDALKHPWFKKAGSKTQKINVSSLKNFKKLSGNNKMKNAVLHYISANQISLETRQKYENIFLEMDEDNDGTLTRQEIKNGL